MQDATRGTGMFDDQPFHLMRVILQEHGARWAERMPDLTKPQYAVLEALDMVDGLDQRALGEASATTKATLTEMLGRMEQRGLITRREDPSDARRRLVHLTEDGRLRLRSARRLAEAVNGEMLAAFSAAELAAFTGGLQQLRDAVRG